MAGGGRNNYATNSAAAILMMVFQFVRDNTAIHRKVMESFMALKEDLAKNVLCVIAHGTPSARTPAANLLFIFVNWAQVVDSWIKTMELKYPFDYVSIFFQGGGGRLGIL